MLQLLIAHRWSLVIFDGHISNIQLLEYPIPPPLSSSSSQKPRAQWISGTARAIIDPLVSKRPKNFKYEKKSQELRMLSSVTINCKVTKIVMNPGSQLPVL